MVEAIACSPSARKPLAPAHEIFRSGQYLHPIRREKFIEYGGRGRRCPAVCVKELNTLIDNRYQPHIKAKIGERVPCGQRVR
jgi:GTPase involved in cell partitioning and DNA repair